MTTKNEETAPTATVYTPEQQSTLDALIATQEQLNLSDERFAKQYLGGYSASAWSRIQRGLYKVQDLERVFTELDRALRSIRHRLARLSKQGGGASFHETAQSRAIFRAVTDCLNKRGENRLIVFAAPTGGGKSRVITELGVREATTAVRANESWRSSFYFAALDIVRALGGTGKFQSAGDARNEMLSLLSAKRQVLAIDEGNYFGTQSINLVKDILNETETVVLLCCTPAHFDKMKRFWAEWLQLQRRLHTTFRMAPITPEETALFLTEAGLNGDAKAASLVLAKAANEFGAFDFISRVTQRLHEMKTQDHTTLADMQSAIAVVKAQLDLAK